MLLVGFIRRFLSDDMAGAKHEDAVGDGEELRHVGGHDDERLAGGGERLEPAVDVGARGDVDAVGRLDQDKYLGISEMPPGDQRLLLRDGARLDGLAADPIDAAGGAAGRKGDGRCLLICEL